MKREKPEGAAANALALIFIFSPRYARFSALASAGGRLC